MATFISESGRRHVPQRPAPHAGRSRGTVRLVHTLRAPRDRALLERRLWSLRADSAARWGRMSANQMLCHLADGFRSVLGERPVRVRGGRWRRTAGKWMVLLTPFGSPRHAVTPPEWDQEIGGTPPSGFASDLQTLLLLLDRVSVGSSRARSGTHPIYGAMSAGQLARWGYVHVNHHLRQFGV